MRPEKILELVDDEQRAAVLAGPGPLLVVAGAGTGKTRTLTCRVAYRAATGQVSPTGVLAVTHSTRAAGEMRDRFSRFGVNGLEGVATRTIHAAALRQLRFFWPATGRSGELRVCEDRYGAMRGALARLGVRSADGPLVADLLAEVEWAKTQLLTPQSYPEAAQAAGRSPVVDLDRVASAFGAYQDQLAGAGLLDFTDLLTEAAAVIDADEQVAAQIRTRYRTVCVDEYQDVDPAQQRLIDAWLGPGRDLTAVGDPRQGIYAFKGADPSLLTSFPARYPDANVLALTRDYRSTPQVVTLANRLAAAADPEPGPRPRARLARAQWLAAHPAPLTGMRPDGPSATCRELADEAAEAQWVAAQVAAAVRAGTPPQEIAVLYRYNAQAAPFEQALTAAGVAYRVADGERFFDRPEVRTVTEEMRRRVTQSGARRAGYDPEDLDGGGTGLLCGASLLREVLSDLGFQRDAPPAGVGATRDRWEALAALLSLVEGLPGAELLGAVELLEDLDTRRAEAHQVTTRAVTLATIHKAKGLEWDTVFCPRWVEGALPLSFAQTPAALEEERRLAYVAVTRARRTLVLSHARTRLVGKGRDARPRPVAASRFLAEAGLTVADGATKSAAAVPRGRGRAARATSAVVRCGRCSVPLTDPALVSLGVCPTHLSGEEARRWASLREWRTQMARLDAVPPYRVLADATLLALVAQAPETAAALGQVKGIGPAKLSRYGAELLALLHRAAS